MKWTFCRLEWMGDVYYPLTFFNLNGLQFNSKKIKVARHFKEREREKERGNERINLSFYHNLYWIKMIFIIYIYCLTSAPAVRERNTRVYQKYREKGKSLQSTSAPRCPMMDLQIPLTWHHESQSVCQSMS